MKAVWSGQTLAKSDDTISIEGNYYFPPDSVNKELLKESGLRSLCYWKGLASYYSIVKGKETAKNVAWHYPRPTFISKKIVGADFANYVAFSNKVKITQDKE